MDRLEKLGKLIRSSIKANPFRLYTYPRIKEGLKLKAIRIFDKSLNVEHIIAFFDTSIFKTGKSGFIFMLEGVYYKAFFKKTYYFNYKDIVNISIDLSKKKGNKHGSTNLIIYFSNNQQLVIKASKRFNSQRLRKALLQLQAKVLRYKDIICFKSSGEVEPLRLTAKQNLACHGIIHPVSVAAGGVGAGLAQIPMSDTAIITPAQIGMIISLGKVFDMNISNSTAKGILAGIATSYGGRMASQALVGWIPGVGNAVNAATAVTITEAVGWLAVAHFIDQQKKDKAKGIVEGKKLGYEEAAREFEIKFRQQAELFIQQEKVYRKQISEYKELLSQCEAYIQELEIKLEQHTASDRKTEEIENKLVNMKDMHKRLKGLKVRWLV